MPATTKCNAVSTRECVSYCAYDYRGSANVLNHTNIVESVYILLNQRVLLLFLLVYICSYVAWRLGSLRSDFALPNMPAAPAPSTPTDPCFVS